MMKSLTLLVFSTLALCFGSTAFAAKEVFQRSKPHVNVGTIGQYDHGKTVLTAALAAASGDPLQSIVLSCKDADGTAEIAIEALLAGVETAHGQYSVYDFDSEGTVQNMVAGPIVQDGAILVVAAADGPMPQTREHVLLARQTGVPAIVVFLNLDGVIYQAQIDHAESEVRKVLSAAGYDGTVARVVRGAASGALRGEPEGLLALAELMDALDERILRP